MTNERDPFSELIDVCRGAEDLQLPELRRLAGAVQTDPQIDQRLKKSQRIDKLLGESLRDVPVPVGLEGRLLAGLADAQLADAQLADTVTPSAVPAAGPSPPTEADGLPAEPAISSPGVVTPACVAAGSGPTGVSSGTWKRWVVGISSVAALALLAFLAFYEPAPSFRSVQDVSLQAELWLHSVQASQWVRTPFPVKQFPLPAQPRLPQPYGWQWVANTHSSLKVACYDFSPKRAHLFVCRGAVDPQLTSLPPRNPIALATGGWFMGSWHSGGVVYVLTVQGNASQYRELIGQNASLAWAARPLPSS